MHYFLIAFKSRYSDTKYYSGHVSDANGNVQLLFSGYTLDGAFRMLKTYM